MTEVTRILTLIDGGDSYAAAQLLPLVYEELRSLAARQLDAVKGKEIRMKGHVCHVFPFRGSNWGPISVTDLVSVRSADWLSPHRYL